MQLLMPKRLVPGWPKHATFRNSCSRGCPWSMGEAPLHQEMVPLMWNIYRKKQTPLIWWIMEIRKASMTCSVSKQSTEEMSLLERTPSGSKESKASLVVATSTKTRTLVTRTENGNQHWWLWPTGWAHWLRRLKVVSKAYKKWSRRITPSWNSSILIHHPKNLMKWVCSNLTQISPHRSRIILILHRLNQPRIGLHRCCLQLKPYQASLWVFQMLQKMRYLWKLRVLLKLFQSNCLNHR